jgi:hypothetical protein
MIFRKSNSTKTHLKIPVMSVQVLKIFKLSMIPNPVFHVKGPGNSFSTTTILSDQDFETIIRF